MDEADDIKPEEETEEQRALRLANRARVLEYLLGDECKLFTAKPQPQVDTLTEREWLRLDGIIARGQGPERIIMLLKRLENIGRQFARLVDLLPALSFAVYLKEMRETGYGSRPGSAAAGASHHRRMSSAGARRLAAAAQAKASMPGFDEQTEEENALREGLNQQEELLKFLNSDRCTMIVRAGGGAWSPAEINRIYEEGGAHLDTLRHVKSFEESGMRFASTDHLISAIVAVDTLVHDDEEEEDAALTVRVLFRSGRF